MTPEKTDQSLMYFAPLENIPWLAHGFVIREPGLRMDVPRSEALELLRGKHERILNSEGIKFDHLRRAEQVHGNIVAHVERKNEVVMSSGADGLITADREVPLGIYVADCCAIYLVDPDVKAVGLLHSGKKGTEGNIACQGVHEMKECFQADPSRIIAVLSPCIHSCCYEVDFISEIEDQLRKEGVQKITKNPLCTSCHVERFYSYRKEQGKTGRMLAFMMIR